MSRWILFFVAAAGCQQSTRATPSVELPQVDAPDASSSGDGGVSVDASIAPEDGSTLFEELFGDASRAGAPCQAANDRCRSAKELLVCTNAQHVAPSVDATCRSCTDDTQCRYEYQFYTTPGVDVRCGTDGTCHPVGADGTLHDGDYCEASIGWCNTHQKGWFVCSQHRCSRCAESEQCISAYGPDWICSTNIAPGSCNEVL